MRNITWEVEDCLKSLDHSCQTLLTQGNKAGNMEQHTLIKNSVDALKHNLEVFINIYIYRTKALFRNLLGKKELPI